MNAWPYIPKAVMVIRDPTVSEEINQERTSALAELMRPRYAVELVDWAQLYDTTLYVLPKASP